VVERQQLLKKAVLVMVGKIQVRALAVLALQILAVEAEAVLDSLVHTMV
jgi:hypothetical protein